jgi:hypothetical protein
VTRLVFYCAHAATGKTTLAISAQAHLAYIVDSPCATAPERAAAQTA